VNPQVSPSKTILVALATVVIFAAGVVTGGLLVRHATPRPPVGAGVPFLGRVETISRTANQLDLTPEQRRRIAEIVRNSREEIADYFMILEPDIQHVFREMRQQIRATLTPSQREEFEELVRKRLNRPGDRRPGPGDPLRPAPGPSSLDR
jgi:Spy/CpxP family protein refolding chaperone